MASSPAPPVLGGRGHGAAAGSAVVRAEEPPDPGREIAVLLFSDDRTTRDTVRVAVGSRPAKDVRVARWLECATAPAVVAAVEAGGLDVLVLDGESAPLGGMGLCRQLKSEIYRCPPVLVLTGRPQDAWLAAWSMADLVVPHPLDPLALANAVAALGRQPHA